jgi:capsule polysaccharide export protein KpsE/RkpR
MSAEIINLKRARKAKQRHEAATRAEQNRAKFGRTKAERQTTEAVQDLEACRIEAARRQRGSDDEPAR